MLDETELHPLTYNDTQSDTSSSDEESVVPEMSFKPMLDILEISNSPQETFVIECKSGLTGLDVMASYPCILSNILLYVWIGTTDISVFGKSTLMNLINLGE